MLQIDSLLFKLSEKIDFSMFRLAYYELFSGYDKRAIFSDWMIFLYLFIISIPLKYASKQIKLIDLRSCDIESILIIFQTWSSLNSTNLL